MVCDGCVYVFVECICCDVEPNWQKAGVDSGRVVYGETNLKYVLRGSCAGFNRYLFLITLFAVNLQPASFC